ncbi:hypothetical protein [Oceanobacillus jeddahense]|uniref:DUF1643 domain-containing protein n=1 Tax=Oceanobacillus jeddahense TaxID=1462527 RepID=A0ABY5JSV5_9BACI|nr:hypothetical protein [Oceanobacillus jeddahense]UUI02532.1 hypothetical protein NP439_21230 [Oceanobacillus jeddahense]
MDHIQAFGEFQKKDGYIFRKSAYLQWGEQTNSIGSFLLLNPGKAKPSNMKNMEGEIDGHYKVDTDLTMKQMVKLVEKIYQADKLNGRIYIYNLFSLRNPKNQEAIMHFEQLAEAKLIEPEEVLPSVEELQKHPWICCGWGISKEKKFKHLQKMKSLWQLRLQESGIRTFGKLHKNGTDYYHIKPQLVTDQELLIDELLNIYQMKYPV